MTVAVFQQVKAAPGVLGQRVERLSKVVSHPEEPGAGRADDHPDAVKVLHAHERRELHAVLLSG
ncbi:hypothetical protein [Streptomyces europaeiscabiei]|uniref:hypothetical protein n=1 Tax=Streptomyces europaeiscabiei TaxID=146819 RepID=UPI0038F71E5F